jgi:hypothetical protein
MNLVYKIYGLKQAFTSLVLETPIFFAHLAFWDPKLTLNYSLETESCESFILIYVDNITVIGNNRVVVRTTIKVVWKEIAIRILVVCINIIFLVQVQKTPNGTILLHYRYAWTPTGIILFEKDLVK